MTWLYRLLGFSLMTAGMIAAYTAAARSGVAHGLGMSAAAWAEVPWVAGGAAAMVAGLLLLTAPLAFDR